MFNCCFYVIFLMGKNLHRLIRAPMSQVAAWFNFQAGRYGCPLDEVGPVR